MPISLFLNGKVFEPEVIQAMGIAFDDACKALKLLDKTDPLTKIVAMKIIELAAAGEHDPVRLCAGVLAIYKPAAE